MPPPLKLHQLIERFDDNLAAYKQGHYNETQARREFVDPLFKLLGWDIDNEQGYAETYKDVVHEDAIKVSGGTKAPDYGFRIGGVRKFFVEAKKPSVDIRNDVHPAYQLRRYAWSAKLPLSILTDFEELAVYDCRIKPDKGDKAATARVLYFKYTEYAEHWDEIAGIFSREAILKGSFDKYVEGTAGKRGTAEVDKAFLDEIERWRDALARNIALRNPGLNQRLLNYAVQVTIDRTLFLRICEDRGIEQYGTLLSLVNGGQIYERLMLRFRHADARYNSGLFHFETEKGRSEPADLVTPGLVIDDKVLKDILKSLYYPDSPYEFYVLPIVILGQVYEQFLGKVIRLTAGHQAKVEEKPEVRKAGGVFYTPAYIVDAIVQRTVGKLVEGKRPGPQGGVSKLRILDMACGSGSFLLGAYQFLLDWHLEQYLADGPAKWATGRTPRLYQTQQGEWKLTIDERKRILLNNLYGVDIDPQAVEVTKLSLLLKVLEGESEQTLNPQLALFPDRVLPDLVNNIQCGNSLIGPDFYDGKQLALLDEDETLRINVFDWQAAFPHVFNEQRERPRKSSETSEVWEVIEGGGFDAVIGNPPYIRMESFKDLKGYLKSHYSCHDERSDLYAYFIERAHYLLKPGGQFGMIVSNKFLRAKYGRPLREFLHENATIDRVVDFAGLPVFRGATVRTIVLLTTRGHETGQPILYSAPLNLDKFRSVADGMLSVDQATDESTYQVSQKSLADNTWSFSKTETNALLHRLKFECASLADYCDGLIGYGIKSGLEEAFVINEIVRQQILERNPEASEIIKPYLNGRDVRRYAIDFQGRYLIYTFRGISLDKYPAVENHLRQFKDRLQRRATQQAWYELQQSQLNYATHFDQPKIVFPDIAIAPRFALDAVGYYGATTTFFIPRRDLYLLGILNSALSYRFFADTCAALEGKEESYLRFKRQYVQSFPVHTIDFTSPADVARHDQMVALVERMLDLHKRLAAEQMPHVKTVLQRQIEATDRQIDVLVYELYGLTDEEIKVVEQEKQR